MAHVLPTTPNIHIPKGYVANYVKNDNNYLKIDAPEGMEIDIESSDLSNGIIKFKKKVVLYTDIVDYLKKHGMLQYPTSPADTDDMEQSSLDRIDAIGMLLNTAKYLNGCWKPEFTEFYTDELNDDKWYITSSHKLKTSTLQIECTRHKCCAIAYFKTKELAQEAIDILTPDVIHKALGD